MPQWRVLGHLAASLRYLCSSFVNANSHPKTLLAAICSPAQRQMVQAVACAMLIFLFSLSANAGKHYPFPFTSDAVTVTTATNSASAKYQKVGDVTYIELTAGATADNVRDLLEAYNAIFSTNQTLGSAAYTEKFALELKSYTTIAHSKAYAGTTAAFLGGTFVNGTNPATLSNATTANIVALAMPEAVTSIASRVLDIYYLPLLEELYLPGVTVTNTPQPAQRVDHAITYKRMPALKCITLGITAWSTPASNTAGTYITSLASLEELSLPKFTSASLPAIWKTDLAAKTNLKKLVITAMTDTAGLTTILNANKATLEVLELPAIAAWLPNDFTFAGFTKLKKVEFATDITAIPDDAFNGCVALEEFTTFGSIVTFGENAFKGCKNLQAVSGVSFAATTAIAASAFEGCEALTVATWPSANFTVGANSFKGCKALTLADLSKLTQSDNVLPDGLFDGCTSLNKIVSAGTVTITTIGKRTFANCGFESIVIPSSVTTISDEAFEGCASVTALDLTAATTLATIGISAFEGLTTLESVTLPATTATIGKAAFKNTPALTNFTFDATATITDIPAEMLMGSGLTAIAIPSSVTSIGANAFANSSKLAKIAVSATTPPTLAANVLGGISPNAYIAVPTGQKAAYEAAAGWSDLVAAGVPVLEMNANGIATTTVTINTVDAAQGTIVRAFHGQNNVANNITPGTATTMRIQGANNAVAIIAKPATGYKVKEYLVTTATKELHILPTTPNVNGAVNMDNAEANPTMPVRYVVIEPATIEVVFEGLPITFAHAGGGGMVNGTNSVTAACGTEEMVLVAEPSEGFTFSHWLKGTTEYTETGDTDGKETITIDVTATDVYRAIFKVVPRIGSITVKNNGKVTVGKVDTP